MATTRIAVVFGSDSDWPVMEKCVRRLAAFGETPHVEIMSAHRTPERVREFAASADQEGLEVIIAGAGMSAALAGTIAAHTCVPVIGVPLVNGALQGIDALLSTVQMPPGIPVAAVGIGDAGAVNAALLAMQIVARRDQRLAAALAQDRARQATGVQQKNKDLQQRIGS